ncbi:MAG: efflux RND transporter permease subunit, partial [Candidatus Hydrothermia bacterium]
MMTLAGIALGVGMLVDASVVVVENIFRREESGESRIDAAINGTEEVWIAISASTFTNIVVFLPLIYIGGLVGQFTQPVAVTVTVTLLASLLVAVTVIPVFISSYITQSVALKEMRKKYWFTGIRDFYERILRKWILPKRGLVIGIAIFLFIASIPLIKVINTEFIPPMDASNAVIQVELPMGTNLKETEHYVNQIIDIASPYPEVERVMAQGGSAGGAVGGESYIATVTINLVDANKRERSADEIVNDILSKVPKYEGGVVKSMDLVNVAVLGGAGKPVEISIFGNDLQELNLVANMVEQELLKIRGITNTEISLKKAKPELRVHINRAKAAYYGFTPVQIQRELQMAFQGVTASNLRLSGDEYNLILKADTKYLKQDIEKLQYFPLLTVAGTIVPLKEVADLVYDYGLVRINRENQSRVVKVLADIEGRTTNEVFSDIRSMLSNLSLPEGFSMQLEGEFEQIQDMMKNLGISIIAAILLIYMVLAAQFESFKDPFVVLFSIPLSFIGVILALLVTGTSISIPSLLGVLILVGVTVNQAIVMVTFYKELRVQGMEPFEAIVRGSVIRIRAIFITNLTTILGLIPMALSGHTEGGAIRAPLAISIIGGLIASTFLSLLVIPVIYSYFEKIRVK